MNRTTPGTAGIPTTKVTRFRPRCTPATDASGDEVPASASTARIIDRKDWKNRPTSAAPSALAPRLTHARVRTSERYSRLAIAGVTAAPTLAPRTTPAATGRLRPPSSSASTPARTTLLPWARSARPKPAPMHNINPIRDEASRSATTDARTEVTVGSTP